MDFKQTKDEIVSSIHEYRSYAKPFSPNDRERDNFLLTQLNAAGSWSELCVLALLRSTRMGYQQEGVAKMEGSWRDTLGLQFNVGIEGWYFLYGMSPDGTAGYLFLVIRFPTIGTKHKDIKRDDRMALADHQLFCLIGYIFLQTIDDDGNTQTTQYNISELGHPVGCPGTYYEGQERVYFESGGVFGDDSKVNISKFIISTDSSWRNISMQVVYKPNKNDQYVQVGIVMNASKTASGDVRFGVMRGDKYGCAECIDGAGTNYWSITHYNGSMTVSTLTTTTTETPSSQTYNMIGWFDHQWGTLAPAVNSFIMQMFSTASGYFKAPAYPRWIWIVLQPSPDVQYTLTKLLDKVDSDLVGRKYSDLMLTTIKDQEVTYGRKADILVMATNSLDNRIPDTVQVTLDSGEVYYVKAASDGRVTLPNTAINVEVPAILYDKNGQKVEGGIGFIEGMNLHDAEDDAKSVMKFLNSKEDYGIVMNKKYTFSQAWMSLSAVAIMFVLLVLIIVMVVYGVYKLATRGGATLNQHDKF